jgi:hypothetical protein
MAVDIDTLKTLQRIEALLSKSLSTTSGSRTTRIAGGASNPANQTKIYKASAVALDNLTDKADTLARSFNSLNKTVNATRSAFVQMNRGVRRNPVNRNNNQPTNLPSFSNPLAFLTGRSPGSTANIQQGLRAMSGSISYASVAITAAASQLVGAIRPVINDFFALHARGIDASSSLGGLYVDAIRAGMSLQEYTEVLENSTPALVRANSFDEFNKRLTESNRSLGELGIFGASATKLSATMASSATVIGVPQEQLNNSISQQIKVFGDLRKTTLMTADGFNAVIQSLSANQEVQSQLLGLSGQERSARFQELIQIQTLGQRMGATKEASDALGAALIEQRKLTAPQRFQAAGLIRQAGSITGMNSADTEELARLGRKKNLTTEEAEIATRLGGQLQQGIEKMLNSGNIQTEYIAEQMQERLGGSGIGRFLGAAGNVALTRSSGEIANDQLGKGANTLVQGAGLLLQYATGLSKNPIAEAITKALGSSAFSIGLGVVLGRVLGRLPIFGGVGRAAGSAAGGIAAGGSKIMDLLSRSFNVGPGVGVVKDIKSVIGWMQGAWNSFIGGVTNIKGTASKITGGLASTVDFLKGGVSNIFNWVGSAIQGGKNLFGALRGAVGTGGDVLGVLQRIAGGAGRILKFIPVVGNLVSVLIDTVGEIFTGTISDAFNPGGGSWVDRIGNVVFAGLNGLFGGIAGIADKAIEFLTGKTFNLENAWERFATLMRGGFFSALASIAEAATFGRENRLSTYFREAADNSYRVLSQLSENQSTTIADIGRKNGEELDKQKAAAQKSEKAMTGVTKSFNAAAGIITDTSNLRSQIISTASQVATPGQTIRPTVNSGDVNRSTDTTPAAPPPAVGTPSAPSAIAPPVVDMTAQLAQAIQVLQQILSTNQSQLAVDQELSRRIGMTPFSDNTLLLNKMIGQN